MNDHYTNYRRSDASSAFGSDIGALPGSMDGMNNSMSQMRRSISAYPQQQPTYDRSAYTSSLSVPQDIPSSTHRSARQNSHGQGPSVNSLTANAFTGPRSAPGQMLASDTRSSLLIDHSVPYVPGRSRTQTQNSQFAALPNLTHYRDALPTSSDVASEASAFYIDSTYASQLAPSQYDGQLSLDEQSLRQVDRSVRSQHDEIATILSSERSAPTRRRLSRQSSRRSYKPTKCVYCDEMPKCESDFRKHMLKHEKPWACGVAGCSRAPFGTVNDLNRHKASVHKILTGAKTFRCAGLNCDKAEKIWPRLDNFKQHVIRIHKDEHGDDPKLVEEICTKSILPEVKPSPASMMPNERMTMETELAGIGEGQPATLDPNNIMHFSINTDLFPTASAPIPDLVDVQDGSQGTRFQYNSSPFKSSSDRLNKAGHASTSISSRSDPRGGGVRKRRKIESPSDGAVSVLADAALNRPSGGSNLHPDDALSNSHRSRSSSLHRDSHAAHAEDDNARQLAQLLEQLKTKIGQNGLLKTLKQMSDSTSVQRGQRHSAPSSMTGEPCDQPDGGFKCETCGKVIARACDLKKHEKRHSRPYGCTFPRCMRAFGSKNDWKRHENSQHFQQEMWRCQLITSEGPAPDGKCGHITWDARKMRGHLRRKHKIEHGAEQLAGNWRIGRSGHTRYWCGYCEDIVPVKGTVRGQAAWDERFNHIDDEHIKMGFKIEDWLCIETRRRKGSPEPPDKKPNTTKATADPEDDSSSDDDSATGRLPPIPGLPHSRTPLPPSEDTISSSDVLLHTAPLQPQGEVLASCCQCGSGPYKSSQYSRCSVTDLCDHEFCPQCYMSV